MRWWAWTFVAVILGGGAGALAGTLSSSNSEPPPPPDLPGVELAPERRAAAALFAEATPTAVAPASARQPAAAPPATEAVPRGGAPTTEVLILPHGSGRFATVDLQSGAQGSLPVYQGAMTRDGPVNLTSIQRSARVGTIRSAESPVELLHLGFDREARLIAAHVRLPETGREGMIILQIGRKGSAQEFVSLRPADPVPVHGVTAVTPPRLPDLELPGPRAAEPPPAAPQPTRAP